MKKNNIEKKERFAWKLKDTDIHYSGISHIISLDPDPDKNQGEYNCRFIPSSIVSDIFDHPSFDRCFNRIKIESTFFPLEGCFCLGELFETDYKKDPRAFTSSCNLIIINHETARYTL